MDIETIAEVLELLNASNTPRVMDRVSPVYGVHFAVCTDPVQSVLRSCVLHTRLQMSSITTPRLDILLG